MGKLQDKPNLFSSPEERVALANSVDLPNWIAEILQQDNNKKVKICLGKNKSVNPRIIRALSLDIDSEIRRATFNNPRLSNARKVKIAEDDNEEDSFCLATCENLPVKAWGKLSRSQHSKVRMQCAGSKWIPTHIVNDMAWRESDDVVLMALSKRSDLLLPQLPFWELTN